MASSSLCCLSRGVTPRASCSDCRFAFWKRQSRSMAIVSDQIDIATSTSTTPRASQFIVCHMPIRLKLVCICSMKTSPLLTISLDAEIDGEVVDDRNGLAVQRARPELPSFHGLQRDVVQSHWQRLEHADVGDIAIAVDD